MKEVSELSKKNALVTGFSSGIGFEYSKFLSERGWELSLVSQNKENAAAAYKALDNPFSRYHLADLSNYEGVSSITEAFKCPDLIVANAGITQYGNAGSLSQKQKGDLFYLLCLGVIDLIEHYLPEMISKQTGRIVIISSIGAITPMPKSSIYAAAKSAIFSYGQSLSKELLKYNIPVTVSLPGYVHTNAHKRAGLDHLNQKVPKWMWIQSKKVVKETEKASLKGKSKVIPGIIYKLVKPFLQISLANSIWNRITRRKG